MLCSEEAADWHLLLHLMRLPVRPCMICLLGQLHDLLTLLILELVHLDIISSAEGAALEDFIGQRARFKMAAELGNFLSVAVLEEARLLQSR